MLKLTITNHNHVVRLLCDVTTFNPSSVASQTLYVNIPEDG